jgi:Zn-finger nucleic acid-binding protein
MSIRLSCPSCNTGFVLDGRPANRRATCPRCGDVFPVRGEVGDETGDERKDVSDQTPETANRGEEPAKRAPSAWRAVLVVLVLLGGAAGLTVYLTRGPKTSTQPPAPPEHPVTPPAQLIGLGYLPADCNVVFAVQPGPVLEYASRTKQEPRELLARAGVPNQVLGALDQIGLPLAQIDHVAGGTHIGDAFELRAVFVLVLKQPLANEDEFRTKLKAKPAAGKQKYGTAELAKLPLMLARVSPTVWVFGLSEADFSAVEKGGFGPGGTQFRGSDTDGLRNVLAAVPPDAAVWVAADDDRDWTRKPLVKLLASSDEVKKSLPTLSALSPGRGAVFALSFGEQSRMRVSVRTADTASAERVRAYFQARAAETESATAGGDGTVASFDAPADPGTLRRFLNDAAK